jgi:hypothetical protein
MDVAEKVCDIVKDQDGRYVVTWNIAGAIKTSEDLKGMLKLYRLVFEEVKPFRAGFGTKSGLVQWVESTLWYHGANNIEMVIESLAYSFKGHPIDKVIFLYKDEADKFEYELSKKYMTWILKQ